jgi:hypothetical protein
MWAREPEYIILVNTYGKSIMEALGREENKDIDNLYHPA